jgi:hypothetical protein
MVVVVVKVMFSVVQCVRIGFGHPSVVWATKFRRSAFAA